MAKSALIQVADVQSKNEFMVALINGVGQQLKPEYRQLFAEKVRRDSSHEEMLFFISILKVFEWFGETAPNFALKLYYDRSRQDIETYHTDPQMIVEDIQQGPPLMKTGLVLKYLDILKPFLVESFGEHLLFAGPHGCAKRFKNPRSSVSFG